MLAPETNSPTFYLRLVAGTVSWMKLTVDDVRDFAAIWSEEFHEAIAEKEAAVAASLVPELFPSWRFRELRML